MIIETEEIKVQANNIIKVLKDLLKKGQITKIVIKSSKGKVLLNVPVNVILAGAVLAPWIAGAGLGIALVKECKIEIERMRKQASAPLGQQEKDQKPKKTKAKAKAKAKPKAKKK
ncbi:DUF4342 domain-containing protein [Candidatus Margulisiibacteriota bacterium]